MRLAWDAWIDVVREMRARWPHAELPDETVAVWYTDVAELDAELVQVALRGWAREGRAWPPTGGQLRARAEALATPAARLSARLRRRAAAQVEGEPRGELVE